MKIEAVNKKTKTEKNFWNPRVEIVTIFPPSWDSTIKELQQQNWQDKHHIRVVYKQCEDLWKYMEENNIIPKKVLEEIEKEKEILENEKKGLWNLF